MTYIRKKSIKQEKRTAKEFGGKTTIASGALYFQKADVRTGGRTSGTNEDDFLIENKFTDKPYYSINKNIWNKLNKEAIRDNLRTPLLQIDVQDLHLVAMDLDSFYAYNNYGNQYFDYRVVSTKKGSFKFSKEELEEYTSGNSAIMLTFESNKDVTLIVMLKETLFDIMDK